MAGRFYVAFRKAIRRCSIFMVLYSSSMVYEFIGSKKSTVYEFKRFHLPFDYNYKEEN